MKKNDFTKYSIMVVSFVVALIILGVSLSYAFFAANFNGNADIPTETAAVLDVTTTLASAPIIDGAKLALIDSSDYLTKAEKIDFSVTNESTSNVKAKYIVKLVEMSLSKNLFSKYLNWALVVTSSDGESNTYTGNFSDANYTEGSTDKTVVNELTKVLISEEEPLILDIDSTDQISFYIWLSNAEVDQLYLTNGRFTAKLSIDAYPTK